jgi:hypothetical protein
MHSDHISMSCPRAVASLVAIGLMLSAGLGAQQVVSSTIGDAQAPASVFISTIRSGATAI